MSLHTYPRIARVLSVVPILLAGCSEQPAGPLEDTGVNQHHNVGPDGRPTTVDGTIAHGVIEADAAFEGVVTTIQHRVSDVRDSADMAVPHTFVTFRVEKAFKAAREGSEVTLRFIGGPTGAGRRLRVSGIPELTVGDRTILMVKENGRRACPLVDCERSLFLLHQEEVRTVGGATVVVGERNQLGVAPRGRPMQGPSDIGAEAHRDLAAEPFNPGKTAERALPVSPADLARRIDIAVRAAFTDEELADLPVIESADISAPFFIPTPRAAVVRHIDVPAPAPESELDRAEQDALARNGGNPVLPAR